MVRHPLQDGLISLWFLFQMADQQKAEKEKKRSEEISVQLSEQMVKIGEKRHVVQNDLDQVEPAVAEARTG